MARAAHSRVGLRAHARGAAAAGGQRAAQVPRRHAGEGKAWPRPSFSPHIRPVVMLVTLGALMAALAVRERLAWACWQEARRREHASRKPKQA